jgi:uncharacterized membrane protein YhaH (DUF805 family)
LEVKLIYYLITLRKYADFSGRARRKEFWHFLLINFAFTMGFLFIDLQADLLFSKSYVVNSLGWASNILDIFAPTLLVKSNTLGFCSTIFQIIIFIPSLAVGFRRMHDLNRSGWWSLVPLIYLFVALFEGNEGDNRFGKDPKNRSQASEHELVEQKESQH